MASLLKELEKKNKKVKINFSAVAQKVAAVLFCKIENYPHLMRTDNLFSTAIHIFMKLISSRNSEKK